MALTRCGECGAAVSEFAERCPQCGFPSAVATKTGKLKSIFETGLAGVGCFLGLVLVVGLLFAPLLPFLAILAAAWVFTKLAEATTKKTDELPADRTSARSRSAAGVGNPDPNGIDGEAAIEPDISAADTFGSRVRSSTTAAASAARTRARRAGRAVKRYWRGDRP